VAEVTDQRDPNKAVDYMIQTAPLFAQARAQRVWLEEFRKSKKALLMKSSPETSSAGQERDAYASPEYIQLLDGLKAAVEQEETMRWQLIAAQARVEIWRTQEASNRQQDRTMR
jgi:hypothetical protein